MKLDTGLFSRRSCPHADGGILIILTKQVLIIEIKLQFKVTMKCLFFFNQKKLSVRHTLCPVTEVSFPYVWTFLRWHLGDSDWHKQLQWLCENPFTWRSETGSTSCADGGHTALPYGLVGVRAGLWGPLVMTPPRLVLGVLTGKWTPRYKFSKLYTSLLLISFLSVPNVNFFTTSYIFSILIVIKGPLSITGWDRFAFAILQGCPWSAGMPRTWHCFCLKKKKKLFFQKSFQPWKLFTLSPPSQSTHGRN